MLRDARHETPSNPNYEEIAVSHGARLATEVVAAQEPMHGRHSWADPHFLTLDAGAEA